MKQFYLAEIVTKDKLIHQRIYFRPSRPGKKAILWVHGLTDNFYGDVATFKEFAKHCENKGWGFASFNTRGHDIVSSVKKLDPTSPKGQTSLTLGSAYETFSDCIYVIEASIDFLANEGFSKIILVGISTGTNKVCYYTGKKKDSRVAGAVLASPISDVGIKKRELGEKYADELQKVKQLIKRGKSDGLVEGIDYMPLTPKRFMSLYAENSSEDTFPYYQKQPLFSVYSIITKPLMIIMGEKDEYADMPISKIVSIYEKFNRSPNFHRVIIKDAFHSFGGKENEFVDAIVRWVTGI